MHDFNKCHILNNRQPLSFWQVNAEHILFTNSVYFDKVSNYDRGRYDDPRIKLTHEGWANSSEGRSRRQREVKTDFLDSDID